MRDHSVHFSSLTPEWATPQDFYNTLDAEFGFTLDPCATQDNAKCEKFFTEEDDGLAQSWKGHVVFMNPPYGRVIGHWVKKAHNEAGGALRLCVSFRPGRIRAGFTTTSTASTKYGSSRVVSNSETAKTLRRSRAW